MNAIRSTIRAIAGAMALSMLFAAGIARAAGSETRQVTNPRREGKYLPGSEFAMQQAIPNFYFHMTTAYEILRHNGLEIGKKDFLGELNYRPL